jgi:2-amino-4-hydroxy-6-hydroxymethyldihydropteridine diphosphokinase
MTVFIAFGSNVGDRVDFCDRAVTLLSLLPHSRVAAVSSLYESEPVSDDRAHPGAGWFLNGVIEIETDITAPSLLGVCREIERALGRDETDRGGPRTLDLDILFYGDQVLKHDDLEIPHPRVHTRRFVLMPMAELAPDWQHPVLHRRISDLLSALPERSLVKRLEPQPSSRYGTRPACSTPPDHADH